MFTGFTNWGVRYTWGCPTSPCGRGSWDATAGERNAPTLAATVALYGRGVRIHRVHEVREIRDGLIVAHTLGMRGEEA